jgi:hypothetical protein
MMGKMPHKGLLLVLGKGKGKGSDAQPEATGSGNGAEGEAYVEAIGEFMAAVKSDNKEAAAQAFSDAMTLCEGYNGEGEASEGEEGEAEEVV